MNQSVEVILALLPFAMLIAGFLVFKLDAFLATLYAFLLQLVVVIFVYHMSLTKIVESSVYGNLVVWAGFLVLYTGQIFGQSYRATGLLEVLLRSVEALFPERDREGRSIALVSVIGGFIGAFNGWSAYPVCILGLVDLGVEPVQAITAYLVFTSWFLPMASLFIASTIGAAATHLSVQDVSQVMGPILIPIVFVSYIGFFRILKFPFFARETQILFWSLSLGNVAAIVLFTQVWPAYYLLTMIAGAAFSLTILAIYGAILKRDESAHPARLARGLSAEATAAAPSPSYTWNTMLRAYAPLLVTVAMVLIMLAESVHRLLNHFEFRLAPWGYAAVSVNLVTTAGTLILVTALSCYFFAVKKSSFWRDIAIASKRARSSLATLVVGSGLVYLMVDAGQISLLGKLFAGAGTAAYAVLNPLLAFLGGLAFGQGLPALFMLAQMQVPVAPALGVSLVVLVAIIAAVTHAPANPLKPTVIRMCASLADVKGRDPEIFRTCLPWALLQVVLSMIVSFILVFTIR